MKTHKEKNTSITNNIVKALLILVRSFSSLPSLIVSEGTVSSLPYPDENFRKPRKGMYIQRVNGNR